MSLLSTSADWRAIAGYPDYEVNESGEVRRITDCATTSAGYRLKAATKRGYATYMLSFRGRMKQHSAHRLVACAFLGPAPTDKHMVAHNDGKPLNNHYLNLRWATAKENQADRLKHGTRAIGEKSHFSKVSDAAAEDIRTRCLGGLSISKAASIYGVTRRQIGNIIKDRQRKRWARYQYDGDAQYG